jgi:anti-anti-sigma factor
VGSVSVERADANVAVVALVGEHDAYSARKLELEFALLQFDRYSIVVDMTRTTFIDSAIVSVMLKARENAKDSGRKFAIVIDDSTGTAVRTIFDVTGLRDVVPVGKPARAALDVA